MRNLTDFGAFVEVEEGIDGLIHISDMSWHRRLKHPSEVLKKGDTVKARVINVDGENQRLSLSIREFLPNEWDNFAKAHNVGDEVIGTVSKITDFGLFIRLADGVEGLAHVSEVQRDPRQKLDKTFHVGEPMRARIIKIDPNERKIGLTTRDVEPLTEEERTQHAGAHDEHARHARSTTDGSRSRADDASRAATSPSRMTGSTAELSRLMSELEPPPMDRQTAVPPVADDRAAASAQPRRRRRRPPPRKSRAGMFFFGALSGCLLRRRRRSSSWRSLAAAMGSDSRRAQPGRARRSRSCRSKARSSRRARRSTLLHSYADNATVKAIVVRINSPGGAIAPSQEIYSAIRRTRSESGKPIVASIDSVAASGGYYIAAACDQIVANPGSITGSIGVILQWFDMKELVQLGEDEAGDDHQRRAEGRRLAVPRADRSRAAVLPAHRHAAALAVRARRRRGPQAER